MSKNNRKVHLSIPEQVFQQLIKQQSRLNNEWLKLQCGKRVSFSKIAVFAISNGGIENLKHMKYGDLYSEIRKIRK